MIIKPLANDDWELFCLWAKGENWKISLQEQRLFTNQWLPCFYVLWDHGCCCGFVSAVIYKTSGWIGNLLIQPQQRGHGYGSMLLDFAIKNLQQARLKRIWLTASEQGAPLYLRRNFQSVDQVVRWSGLGTGAGAGTGQQSESPHHDLNELLQLDLACWQESRSSLINLLADDSILLKTGSDLASSLALLQTGLDFWQIGPWVSTGQGSQDAQALLEQSCQRTPLGKPLVVDSLKSAGLDLALRQAGFTMQGRNELMCLSQETVTLSGVNALASLGSIG